MDKKEIVDLNKLPSNSRKMKLVESSNDQPSIDKVPTSKIISGKVIKQKRSIIDRFAETFFGDDAKTVGLYVIWDVLIPAAKTTISEMVQTGLDMLLFGEKQKRNTRDNRTFVSYGSFYNKGPGERERNSSFRRSTAKVIDNIIFESRSEAEEVLEAMAELINTYGYVSLSDFYSLVGEESEYTDEKYGWTNMIRARVERVRGGYIINMPRAMAL